MTHQQSSHPRSQDFGHCASAALPEVVNLAPISSSWFWRTGKWADKNGAEHVNWEQNRFRIDYTSINYLVDLKPWFQAKVLRNVDLELAHMRIDLPAPHKKPRAMTTVVFMDCVGTPMYVSREFKGNEFEIFNHIGELVATGSPSEMVPSQMYFKDDKGISFAIAGSPTIATGVKEVLHQRHLYDFDHWQIWFMDGFNSQTYLKEPDSRWVIAAVVQEHAILQTLMPTANTADPLLYFTAMPVQYQLFLLLILATCLGGIGLCLLAFRGMFFMVYPPKKVFKGNPFLVEDIGGQPYGTLPPAYGN